MDCLEYMREYLAAHADNELSPSQKSAAEAILADVRGAGRAIRERTLKQAIRRQVRLNRAPGWTPTLDSLCPERDARSN